MAEELKKVPARFWRNAQGAEPVRDWLHSLSREDRRRIGGDIATVEYGWPLGMPTCRSLGAGLWEVRTTLEYGRIARVLFCFADGQMMLLHGFIKKTQRAPREDMEIARKRQRELEP